jgi:inhibitor of cysteine peptidase
MRHHPTMRTSTVAALVLAAVIGAGCAAANTGSASAPVTPPDPVSTDLRGSRIEVRIGEAFEVRLPSNPSTGYRWELVDPVPGIVRAVGVSRVEPTRGDLVGAPGQEVWRFEGATPGIGRLGFIYRRPFEPASTPPAQRTSYRVEVR